MSGDVVGIGDPVEVQFYTRASVRDQRSVEPIDVWWCPATVTQVHGDGSITVVYATGERHVVERTRWRRVK